MALARVQRADNIIIARWADNEIIALYMGKYRILWLIQNDNNLQGAPYKLIIMAATELSLEEIKLKTRRSTYLVDDNGNSSDQ